MAENYIPSFLSHSDATGIATSRPLENIDWEHLMHPEDRSAIATMEAVPCFSAAMKAVLTGVVEKISYGQNIGNALKLGPDQLPEYYNLLLPVCETLGLDKCLNFSMIARTSEQHISILAIIMNNRKCTSLRLVYTASAWYMMAMILRQEINLLNFPVPVESISSTVTGIWQK